MAIITISKKAIDFIISKEVTSQQLYEKKYAGVVWPGGDSGLTVGLGYDLGYMTATDIESDWIIKIGANQVSILKQVAGLKGAAAQKALAVNNLLKQIFIPYKAAVNVFTKKSLPKYARQAMSIYPGIEKLNPDTAGALISLVYNRGTKLDGDRRIEMKAIVPLVAAKDYAGIAFQIDKMKRLWDNGLVQRREQEAALVKNSERYYDPSELREI
jgi:GH24 family phage-related lysozyme (muramidase)